LELLARRSLILHRQAESKACAAARFALGPHPAAVGRDELLDDREPQPGASRRARPRGVRAVETLEDEGQVVGGAQTSFEGGDYGSLVKDR